MIPIAKPCIDEAEAQAACRAILSGWITQGPEVAAFEREFAQFVNAPHACAVSNCTTALHLALLAAGVKQGDEVITVSHSFIATANSILYCGAVPVFVDICPDTFNMDVERVEAAITPSTKAILCVHQMGMPCDLSELVPLAQKHSLPLIEDAACAIGSQILWQGRWENIGKPHGDAACFSFHPRKVISTGDGGMVTTKHEEWDRKIRLLRQHGMSISDTARHAARQVTFEEYLEVGFNYRMTDIQAAIGREQLKRLPEITASRRRLALNYREALKDISSLKAPSEPEWARSNWQSFCVSLAADLDQVQTMQALLEEGIATRRGIMCTHREPAYKNQDWRAAGTLECSEKAQIHSILLPLYAQMTGDEQGHVVSALQHVACAEWVR